MKITICGSMVFAKEMTNYRSKLQGLGFEVAMPHEMENFDYSNYSPEIGAERKIRFDFIRKHYDEIINSDAILVINYEKNGIKNYIGGNTLLEIGFAFVNNRDIFMVNPSPDLSYKSEIDGMKPIVINEDIEIIKNHYERLTKVYLASGSKIKIKAVALGLRKINFRSNVIGIKEFSDSAHQTQPIGFEELVQTAENRLGKLKESSTNGVYLIVIESGLIKVDNIGHFDVALCIMENENGDRNYSISNGTLISDEISSKVINENLELGPLLQQIFKVEQKDPAFVFTNGKITRQEILENLVANTFGRFK